MLSETDPLTERWDRTIEDAFIAGPQDGLPIVHTQDPLVDFVPADLDLSNFEKDTSNSRLKEFLLYDLLEGVKDNYDFVIIDCPPALTSIVANAMVASDYIIIVANPDGLSYKGAQMIIKLYNDIISDKRLNPMLKILGIMITRYQPDNISNLFLEQFKADYGQIILKPVIRKSTKIVQATSFNRSIFEFDPKGKSSEDYARLSQELLLRVDSDIRHNEE
jgi:chromosome partitioning protein